MQSRHQWSYGQERQARATGATDWLALEDQLNRTRVILREILSHLQEVLKSLKSARAAFKSTARPQAAGASTRTESFRAADTGAGHRQAYARPERPSYTSERFRARPQTGFGAKAKPAGTFRAAKEEAAKAEAASSRASASSSKTFTSSSSKTYTASAGTGSGYSYAGARDRTKAEGPYRARPGTGQAGSARDSRFSSRATERPSAQATERPRREGGFRPDNERQQRGREAARRNGMNLKTAYDILCLDYPCSVDQVKNAYRNMARIHHPDLGGDEETMKDLNIAYEMAMRFCAGPRRTSAAWGM